MSVKIVRLKEVLSFNPSLPLEEQVRGAKQVVVDYNPDDSAVGSFMEQFERIAKSGISCQMNIKFNSNHTLQGYRAERQFDFLIGEIETNELIKQIVALTDHTDRRLSEISEMCGSMNER